MARSKISINIIEKKHTRKVVSFDVWQHMVRLLELAKTAFMTAINRSAHLILIVVWNFGIDFFRVYRSKQAVVLILIFDKSVKCGQAHD